MSWLTGDSVDTVPVGGSIPKSDDEHWNEVAKALAPLAKIPEILAKFGEMQDAATPEYDAFTIRVPRNQTLLLLGYDLSRVKAYFVSSENGVYIGKRNIVDNATLDLPNGFILPQSGGREFIAVGDVYARFVGTTATTSTTADIGVLVFRSANEN